MALDEYADSIGIAFAFEIRTGVCSGHSVFPKFDLAQTLQLAKNLEFRVNTDVFIRRTLDPKFQRKKSFINSWVPGLARWLSKYATCSICLATCLIPSNQPKGLSKEPTPQDCPLTSAVHCGMCFNLLHTEISNWEETKQNSWMLSQPQTPQCLGS